MDDTDNRFGRSITRLTKEAHRYFSQTLAPLDLAPGMQAYLLILSPDVPLAQKEMSERLQVDPANVTRALKTFEHRGWIQRTRLSPEGKEWTVSLTASGSEVRQKVAAAAEVHTRSLRQRLTEDQWNILTELLEKAAGITGE